MEAKKYPNHEKLNSEQLLTLDQFHDFLEERGLVIADINSIGYYDGHIKQPRWNDLRVEFFGVNQKELEIEREQMIAYLIEKQKK